MSSQRRPHDVFPCTSPLTIGSDESGKNNAAFIKSTKPVMGLPPSKRDVPTVSSTTRRLLPSVKEIAARFNGQMKSADSSPSIRYTPKTQTTDGGQTHRSVASGGSKDRIDEIRASITKLKYDGVGGIGKATSTLVRNQETGRYIIRDVSDDHFDDIMLAEMMKVDESSPREQQQRVVMEHVGSGAEPNNNKIGNATTVFRMPSQNSSNGSVVSDGVVDDAVRAVMDAVSSTSTDDVLNEASDDFFVVAKSGRHTAQWPSFPSANKQAFIEDAFDIDPLNDWDDSGSDEWRDEKDFSGNAGTSCLNVLPSPTSVILGRNRKMARDDKVKNQQEVVGVASWNPFDM
jgi:sorbitol-specific phosphotransferase system component IIA